MGATPTDIVGGWREHERVLSTPSLIDGADDEQRPTLIRPEIEQSWRRCQAIGVEPMNGSLPYSPDISPDSRLKRAASPIIDRLAEQLEHAPVTILLADVNAQIIDRRTGRRDLLDRLDNASVAPGFSFSEESAGTNGIGTALEERKLFDVRGGEHLRESLRNLACVGSPIVHPVSRTVEGILDITCNVVDVNDLMQPLIVNAVRDIENRLFDQSTQTEQALLREYLSTCRRASAGVVAMSHNMIIANPAALRMMDPSDQVLLWEWATTHLDGRGECGGELRFHDGTDIRIDARRFAERKDSVGVIVEIRPVRVGNLPPVRRTGAAIRTGRVQPESERLVGRSLATRRLQAQLDEFAKLPAPVLVSGESGTGKHHVAAYLQRRWGHTDPVAVVDAAVLREADIEALREQLENGVPAIVSHVEQIPAAVVPRLRSLLSDSTLRNAPLIATADEDANSPVSSTLCARFSRRATIVPLRQRTEEIEDLARVLLGRHVSARPLPRLQPAALQSLMRNSWPSNVRELESVLVSACVRSMGFDVAVQHLPDRYRGHGPTRKMAQLERMEREAVLQALDECDGNKSLAADRLGIARSTLYRKLRALGIESDRFAD